MTYQNVKSIFWSENVWLSANITWADFKQNDDDLFIPDANDLLIVIPFALCLLIARWHFEKYVAILFGRRYYLRESPKMKTMPSNPLLEHFFVEHPDAIESDKQDIIGQLNWSARLVDRWVQERRATQRPSVMCRFQESSWRFIIYLFMFCFGLAACCQKPWFWDHKLCWIDNPRLHVPGEIRFYYMLELSFYTSLLMSVCMDVRRKDFHQMIVHHVTTILLMTLSWTVNHVRVGCLVLVCHDLSDILLEGGKLVKYCRGRGVGAIFVLFAISWVICRLIIYPFWIIRTSIFDSYAILGRSVVIDVLNSLLCLLLVLHVIWFYMILQTANEYFFNTKVLKYTRSDCESEYESDEETGEVGCWVQLEDCGVQVQHGAGDGNTVAGNADAVPDENDNVTAGDHMVDNSGDKLKTA